jgi:FkbM family methyltransferase
MSQETLQKKAGRKATLELYDLSLLQLAQQFRLESPDERKRSTRELEHLFFSLVRRFAPAWFIEAGAKDARASRKVADAQTAKQIVAFEANPYTYERFSHKYDFPSLGIDYVHTALGAHAGETSFNVRRTDDGVPIADGQGSLMVAGAYAPGHERVTVPMKRLDDHLGARTPSVALWIDVEGAHEQVLAGAERALELAQLVFIEVEDHAFWDGQWLWSDVHPCLFGHGLVPIARDFQSKWQYNVVLVRRSLLGSRELRTALANYHSRIGSGARTESAQTALREALSALRARRGADKLTLDELIASIGAGTQ